MSSPSPGRGVTFSLTTLGVTFSLTYDKALNHSLTDAHLACILRAAITELYGGKGLCGA
jgi:hypothetical protein